MANEKTVTTTSPATSSAPAASEAAGADAAARSAAPRERAAAAASDAAPQIISDDKEFLSVSPHDMNEDVDPAYAGDYVLTHGVVRIPVPDGNGGFVARGKVYRTGAKLRLGALDAYRFLESGVVRRIDGKMPNKVAALDANAA